LIIGLYANLATYVPYDLFVAFGRADFNARYHLLELGPYLLLTAWLTHRWGIVGAALAWSSRVMIGFPLYLIFVRRSFGLLSGLSLGFLLTQAVALLVMFVPMLAGVRFSGSWQWSITFNVAGLISYLGIVWFGLLNTAEKKRLRDLVQRHLSSKAIAFG
jgi:O-antigen/teichoic acid export membrane protein